jgi:hypothetical protein
VFFGGQAAAAGQVGAASRGCALGPWGQGLFGVMPTLIMIIILPIQAIAATPVMPTLALGHPALL